MCVCVNSSTNEFAPARTGKPGAAAAHGVVNCWTWTEPTEQSWSPHSACMWVLYPFLPPLLTVLSQDPLRPGALTTFLGPSPDCQGIIEDAVLLGAPVDGEAKNWEPFRKVVSGRDRQWLLQVCPDLVSLGRCRAWGHRCLSPGPCPGGSQGKWGTGSERSKAQARGS